MPTELAIFEKMGLPADMSYEDLARMTGQQVDVEVTHKGAFANASFSIADTIEDKDGNEYEVERKTIRISHPDGPLFVKNPKLVVLGRYFMYQRWDEKENKYTAVSEISPDFKGVELRDTSGGFNAGRATGYINEDQWAAMTPDEQKIQKDAKLVRVVYALVSGKATKTAGGDEIEVTNEPVKFRMSRSIADQIEGLMGTFQATSTLSFTKYVGVTIKPGKAGAFPIGEPTYKIDTKSNVDMELVKPHVFAMVDDVKGHNRYVVSEFDKNQKPVADASDTEEDWVD